MEYDYETISIYQATAKSYQDRQKILLSVLGPPGIGAFDPVPLPVPKKLRKRRGLRALSGLLLLPSFFETKLKIQIPTAFEMTIYLFIFAAEIMGEINHYYVLIPGWDTMLHTINGFLCAVVGFSLVDLLNQNSASFELSPLYVTIVAFCFSMTIGVLWEFFEFSADQILHFDTQKDYIVTGFSSVTLDPNHAGNLISVSNITETIIHTASGETIRIENGYLDIGIIDTMKDLLVNFLGAIVCSVLGYQYITHRDNEKRQKLVSKLLIRKL